MRLVNYKNLKEQVVTYLSKARNNNLAINYTQPSTLSDL